MTASPSATGDPLAGLSRARGYTTPSRRRESFRLPPPSAVGGQVDFEAVFAAAGENSENGCAWLKPLRLVRSLPAGTEMAVEKQIVEAALKAFGVPDWRRSSRPASKRFQALDGYVRNGAADNEKTDSGIDARIKQYGRGD